MNFPGVADFMAKYQAKAGTEGVDPLGYYIGPWGYAQLEVLQQAVYATKSAQRRQARRLHPRKHVQDRRRRRDSSASDGEWAQSRVLQVQFQNVKGNDIAQFKDISTQVVVSPAGIPIRQGDLSLREGEIIS